MHGRKNMKVLIDTNVIIDALIGRQPYYSNADKIIKLCADKKVTGYMAAHSIPDIFYILRKDWTENQRRELLLNLCDILFIEKVDSEKIISALQNKKFKDMEDCLQYECAASVLADYIITRNIKDFYCSVIPAILPEDFLNLLMS